MEMFQTGQQALPNSAANATVEARLAFIKKVYGLLTVSLVFAAAAAYIGKSFITPGMMFVMFILQFAMIFVVQAVRHKPGINLLALFGFTTLSGLTLAPVILVYELPVIQDALVLTVVIFGALTAYVMGSKRDFSFMGGFLFVGLIAILAGSLLNVFFFQNAAMEFVVSVGGVILFSGFILYDTSNILRRYDVEDYTSATLSLYLDILNLFLFLLRLLSGSRN